MTEGNKYEVWAGRAVYPLVATLALVGAINKPSAPIQAAAQPVAFTSRVAETEETPITPSKCKKTVGVFFPALCPK